MLSEFYKQVFEYWNELYKTPTIHVQDHVEGQTLWYNSSICVDTKPVYYTFWIERSILIVAETMAHCISMMSS